MKRRIVIRQQGNGIKNAKDMNELLHRNSGSGDRRRQSVNADYLASMEIAMKLVRSVGKDEAVRFCTAAERVIQVGL